MRSVVTAQLRVELDLNEGETAALNALTAYGTDEFIKAFYEKMGKSALVPHEEGLRSLFEKAKKLSGPLHEVATMRKAYQKSIEQPVGK